RAADPHVLGRLLLREPREETRALALHPLGPGAVVGEEVLDGGHGVIFAGVSCCHAGLDPASMNSWIAGQASNDKSSSHRLGEQLAADQHAADLAGARADLVQLGVAPQAPERVVV